MVDVSAATQNIPPQVLAALQQQSQGMSGGDITSILAQLAEMSPDELSAALQQLGINIPPDQLVSAAENWLESAAGKQAGTADEEAGETTPDDETAEAEAPAAAPAQEQAQEQADEEGGDIEGQMQNEESAEQAALPPNARPTGYSPQQVPQAAAMPPTQARAMPVSGSGRLPPSAAMRSAASSGSTTMDDLISAAMMQQAAGNPNAAVPMPGMRRARMPGAPTSLGNLKTPNPASTRSNKRG